MQARTSNLDEDHGMESANDVDSYTSKNSIDNLLSSPTHATKFKGTHARVSHDREGDTEDEVVSMGTGLGHDTHKGFDTSTLRLLTFNTWGLKYVSKFRHERLRAIADKLAGVSNGIPLEEDEEHSRRNDGATGTQTGDKDEYDVIALQEIWCREDWEYLVMKTRSKYPYHRWFSSGILTGPGLAILSKLPIEETFLYRFPINGRPSAFWRGDWYVGKSVSVTILQTSSGNHGKSRGTNKKICLLNSHMHAPYAQKGDAAYYCHRSCQSWDIAKLIRLYREAGYYVILVGDLNSKPGTLPYKFLTEESGLTDSWDLYHRMNASSTSNTQIHHHNHSNQISQFTLADIEKMKPIEQIKYGGCTCDSLLNTWRADRAPTEACRLDYALVDKNLFMPVSCDVKFTERIPTIGSYSDHFAYSCTLKLLDRETLGDEEDDNDGLVNDRENRDTKGGKRSMDGRETRMMGKKDSIVNKINLYNEFLFVLHDYFATAYWQKSWRLIHFWLSVLFLIAMVVIVTFTSNRAGWSSVIILLASIVVAITGLIDGIIGFLFGNKEIRALREVEQEVIDQKNGLQMNMNYMS